MNRVGHWFGKKKQQLAESSTGQKVAAKAGKEIPERNMSADDEAFAALHTTLKQFKDPADRLKTRAGSLPAHGEAMGDSYANLSKAMTECSSIPTMDGIAKWSSTFDVLVRITPSSRLPINPLIAFSCDAQTECTKRVVVSAIPAAQ
jgi:hypothetical protein